MKRTLQNKLFEAFPKLFAQKDEDMSITCMCWGIECPDAWYDVIYTACALLQTMTDNNTRSDKYPQVQFTQVKEKFGALCMYNDTNTDYVKVSLTWLMPWCNNRIKPTRLTEYLKYEQNLGHTH